MKKTYLVIGIVVLCLLLLLFFCFFIGSGKGGKEVTKIQIPAETFSQEYYEEVHQAVKDNKKASRLIFEKDTPTKTAEGLWPTKGTLVATINGKEYYYDPIYLYRLTAMAWESDPNLVVRSHIFTLGEGDITGILDSCTLKDNAIYYELLYLESRFYASEMKESFAAMGAEVSVETMMESQRNHYNEILDHFLDYDKDTKKQYPIRNLTKVVAGHENAKFYQGQGDKNYWRQVEPYMEKYVDICEMSSYLLYRPDMFLGDTNGSISQKEEAYYQLLKEKYHVEIIV